MRLVALTFLLVLRCAAQHTLYATASQASEYVVGARLPSSGVFQRLASGEWRHRGFNHPFTAVLTTFPDRPDTLYLASGNGLIELTQAAERWKILTGSDVTELRDVTVHPQTKTLLFTHTRGIQMSKDLGKSWAEIAMGLEHRYVDSVRVDREHSSVFVAATEAGLFRSDNEGASWTLAGAQGVVVLRAEQSPTDGCRWLATTELGGIYVSTDCAKTFESAPGRMGVDRSLYGLAWDSRSPHRVATGGFYTGVAVSVDDGKNWTPRNTGLPSDLVWDVAFDPDHAGRLYCAVHREGVYVSDDAGEHWRRDGLPGTAVSRFTFVPGVSTR